jgi:hypothetical protein
MGRLHRRMEHSGFAIPWFWPINPIMHRLFCLFAISHLATAAWISEEEQSTTAERATQEHCEESAGGGLQCRKILLQQERSDLEVLRSSDLEEIRPGPVDRANLVSQKPSVSAASAIQNSGLIGSAQANTTNPRANISNQPAGTAHMNLAHHGTDKGTSATDNPAATFSFPMLVMRILHGTAGTSPLVTSVVILVSAVLFCSVVLVSSLIASQAQEEGDEVAARQLLRNLSYRASGSRTPPRQQEPACKVPPSPSPMQSPMPSDLPSNTPSMRTLWTASPGKMNPAASPTMPKSLHPTPERGSPAPPHALGSVTPASRHLCPGLVVPENNECCLAVPSMRSVGLPQQQSAAFDVLDLSGKSVIRAEVNAPSVHDGPVSTAIDSRPILIIRAAAATMQQQLLAYCKTDREAKGRRSVYFYDARDELFAHLAKDPFRNCYILTGGTVGLQLTFDGNFQEHAVTITNEHGEVQADAFPAGQSFISQMAPGHYQLRIVSCVDVGLMLCAVLAIDHMETEWGKSPRREE